MEFKVSRSGAGIGFPSIILIETQWNLKMRDKTDEEILAEILIETQWNLKIIACSSLLLRTAILIETQWNLKFL